MSPHALFSKLNAEMVGVHDPNLIWLHFHPLQFVSLIILDAQLQQFLFEIGEGECFCPDRGDLIHDKLCLFGGVTPFNPDAKP